VIEVPDTDRATMRASEEIAAAHDRVLASRNAMLDSGGSFRVGEPYTRGQLAALAWVLGTAETSPLTGQAGIDVADTWAVANEQYLATNMLYRRVEMDRRGNDYVSGVEVALMWVRHQTDFEL
jgi:hypothetical protein